MGCLIYLFGQLFPFDCLELLCALDEADLVMVVVVFEVTKASHHKIALMNQTRKIWQCALLLQLFAIGQLLKVEGVVFLDSVEMEEFAG